MKVMEISSAKGGVGVTTTACATAVIASEWGKVLLMDMADNKDTPACMGAVQFASIVPNNGSFVEVNDTLTLFRPWYDTRTVAGAIVIPDGNWDTVIIDAGTTGQQDAYIHNGDPVLFERVVCVTNCYMGVRNTLSGFTIDSLVLMNDPSRVLTIRDIEVITGKTAVVNERNDKLPRAIDAGVILDRKEVYGEWARKLLSGVGV